MSSHTSSRWNSLRNAGFGLALFALASVAPSAHAQTFDAAGDFSAVNNPNGVWSYGYETSLGSTLNLYTNEYSYGTSIKGWNRNIATGDPIVEKNIAGSTFAYSDIVLAPGQLLFHPGPDDEFSIVRFVAAQSGAYSLDSSFTPVTTDGTTTDVHIMKNGTSLFDGIVTGTYKAPTSAPSFSDSLFLKAGDTVDFAVGYGPNGNYYRDSTGLSATLMAAPVPEASSVVSLGLLLLLGLGGIAVSRKRKGQAAA